MFRRCADCTQSAQFGSQKLVTAHPSPSPVPHRVQDRRITRPKEAGIIRARTATTRDAPGAGRRPTAGAFAGDRPSTSPEASAYGHDSATPATQFDSGSDRQAMDMAMPSRMSCSLTISSPMPARRASSSANTSVTTAPPPITSTRPGCIGPSAARSSWSILTSR